MPAISKTETVEKEEVQDDISDLEVKNDTIDLGKLAALKAKNQAKQQDNKMANKIVAKKERALLWGVVGTGQGGSRLAEQFYKCGYPTIAMNTANQDLKFIAIPDNNKLLLEYGVGGASKELEIGKTAAETHKNAILELINDKLSDSQMNILCSSLGGGSGAGSIIPLIECLNTTGKPLLVIAILPMDSEDSQTKMNSLNTLSKLANMVKDKTIANLIIVDNAKLESIYHNVSQMNFFEVANQAIVEPLNAFNEYSAQASNNKSLDPMELSKLLIDGNGISTYGKLIIDDYKEDTKIAEAIISNLNNNLLSSGFDISAAKYVGFIVIANENVWKDIPSSSINYASSMINELCKSPNSIFKGVYTGNISEDVVHIYSFFSGLSLPEERVNQLKQEVAELQVKVKDKDIQRNLNLQLDTGNNKTISDAQKIKDKIAAKNSTFGKFVSGSVVDRRNK